MRESEGGGVVVCAVLGCAVWCGVGRCHVPAAWPRRCISVRVWSACGVVCRRVVGPKVAKGDREARRGRCAAMVCYGHTKRGSICTRRVHIDMRACVLQCTLHDVSGHSRFKRQFCPWGNKQCFSRTIKATGSNHFTGSINEKSAPSWHRPKVTDIEQHTRYLSLPCGGSLGKSGVNVWYGSPQDNRVLWYSPLPPWATTHVRHVLSRER